MSNNSHSSTSAATDVGAFIQDLAVDTLKIKGRSVTVPSVLSGNYKGSGYQNRFITDMSLSDCMKDEPIAIFLTVKGSYDYGWSPAFYAQLDTGATLVTVTFNDRILTGVSENNGSPQYLYPYSNITSIGSINSPRTGSVRLSLYASAQSGATVNVNYTVVAIHCKR